MMLVALLIQAATVAPDVPQQFSILAPPACTRRSPETDIVVCGSTNAEQRLPLPEERGPPDRAMPSNPNGTGIGALNAAATPCAATQWGCQVGANPLGPVVMAVRAVGKLINPSSDCCTADQQTDPVTLVADGAKGVASLFKKKQVVDKSGRVAIPLEDPPLRPLEP